MAWPSSAPARPGSARPGSAQSCETPEVFPNAAHTHPCASRPPTCSLPVAVPFRTSLGKDLIFSITSPLIPRPPPGQRHLEGTRGRTLGGNRGGVAQLGPARPGPAQPGRAPPGSPGRPGWTPAWLRPGLARLGPARLGPVWPSHAGHSRLFQPRRQGRCRGVAGVPRCSPPVKNSANEDLPYTHSLRIIIMELLSSGM